MQERAGASVEPELGAYKHAKGSIQLPLNRLLPRELIARIVQHNVEAKLRTPKR